MATKKLQTQETSRKDSDIMNIKQIVNEYNLQSRNGRQYSRFAIEDKVGMCLGQANVIQERKSMTLPLLKEFYMSRVMQRCMRYHDISEDRFDILNRFLTDKTYKFGMLMNGETGTGKTTMALAMIDVIRVLYKDEINSSDLAIKISVRCVKASELGAVAKLDSKKFEDIKKATILYIDDVAFNGEGDVINDYGTKRRPFEEILEYRYDNQLMTIVTSNLDLDTDKDNVDSFQKRYGKRIYSRMCEMFAVMQLGRKDYRV